MEREMSEAAFALRVDVDETDVQVVSSRVGAQYADAHEIGGGP